MIENRSRVGKIGRKTEVLSRSDDKSFVRVVVLKGNKQRIRIVVRSEASEVHKKS